MVNDIEKEIEAAKAKVAELENLRANQEKLAGLPSQYGFSDLTSFIKALKRAVGDDGVKAPKEKKAVEAKKEKKGKRARITPEVKNQVKALVADGKTGAEIAKSLGISLPSVQNIKKEFGLVKERR